MQGAAESGFDMGTALAEFLADPTCMELQLPHMTTGQRKQAKKLADQHPEIKCESYGFGVDRRLHFFKQGTSLSSKISTSDAEQSSHSTAASPHLSRTSSEDQSSALDDMHGSLSPELIRVRNTFIHVESASLVDDRAVQSMPHGMFSSCWLEEVGQSLAQSPPGAPRITAPPPAAAPKEIFPAGTEVVIVGLTKCPAFNGLQGNVQSFDGDAGRYNVLLASHDGSTGQYAKIKGENLQLEVPPPPSFESFARVPEELQAVTDNYLDAMPATPEWQSGSTFQLPGSPHVHYPSAAFPVHAAR